MTKEEKKPIRDPCSACKGTGLSFYELPCAHCNGTGKGREYRKVHANNGRA